MAPRKIFKLHIPFQNYYVLVNREEKANKTSTRKYCGQKEGSGELNFIFLFKINMF